jgi:hypothetical protein
MTQTIELVLFENDFNTIQGHIDSGITSFIVDLEFVGKNMRQLGFDTEIRPGTIDDLRKISSIPNIKVWSRINQYNDYTPSEVESVIASGAQIILLPMVTTLDEVVSFIELVNNRSEVAIMIETKEGAALAADLRDIPIDYVFFGLNDFAISRGSGSIFNALADGSVEQVRQGMPDFRFGFGGLTDLRRGFPIPSSYLLEEMSRLRCNFTFLRRSFMRDCKEVPPKVIVEAIQNYWYECSLRTEEHRHRDHAKLVTTINDL